MFGDLWHRKIFAREMILRSKIGVDVKSFGQRGIAAHEYVKSFKYYK